MEESSDAGQTSYDETAKTREVEAPPPSPMEASPETGSTTNDETPKTLQYPEQLKAAVKRWRKGELKCRKCPDGVSGGFARK